MGTADCSEMLAGWAVGMTGQCYNPQAGFLMGKNGPKVVSMQVKAQCTLPCEDELLSECCSPALVQLVHRLLFISPANQIEIILLCFGMHIMLAFEIARVFVRKVSTLPLYVILALTQNK